MTSRISPTSLMRGHGMDDYSEEGKRPGSADSRTAWDDNYDPSSGLNTVSATLPGRGYGRRSMGYPRSSSGPQDAEGEPAEAALDDVPLAGPDEPVELAGPEVDVELNAPAADDTSQPAPPRRSFGIFGCIRSMWGTRQTEDTENDRELYIRTTLRELFIYLTFIIVLCVITFGMTSSTYFYYTKVMQELFLDTKLDDSTSSTFRDISTMSDFWKFAKGPLLNGLYWETWYNGEALAERDKGYIYYENKLLGVPRMRQVKVKNASCTVHPDFQAAIADCYDSYDPDKEATEKFGPAAAIGTAWYYTTEDNLDGGSHWGKLDFTYSGAGYYLDLNTTKAEALAQIEYLEANTWIDRGTRVVFIDFTVYNANINLFCVVRLVMEFPATGGAVPSWQFRTVKLIRYVTTWDYVIMGFEFAYLLFIFYYTVEEILEIKHVCLSYFTGFWNWLDLGVVLLSYVAVGFHVYRTQQVDNLLEGLLEDQTIYPNFESLGFWQTQYNNMVAIVVFLAWIKIFKYISFNRTMTQLQSTLARCSKDILGFAIMFFIIFLAYAQLGYLVFGTQVADFSNFNEAIFTLFRIILGDFDFHALEEANRVLGPLFFITYVFFVFFVLLNMFLAIINDTYSEVKAEISQQKSEFEITDYFKRGYNKILEKLSLKKDHIRDIQDAIASADHDGDQKLDWEEWRLDLKMRGIPDAEIEAVFAKYDQDGDMILTQDEQRKLHADLEKQRSELKDEIDLATGGADGQQRPPSARSKGAVSHVSVQDSVPPSDDDDLTEEEELRRMGNKQLVSKDDFQVLTRRVDRMEHSIGSIVSKIDAVIVKLEAMERAKLKRRETMNKLLENITDDEKAKRGVDDEQHREQMERLVREELERWDSDASIASSARHRQNRPHSGRSLASSESAASDRSGHLIARARSGAP